jgi:hypothetical protein
MTALAVSDQAQLRSVVVTAAQNGAAPPVHLALTTFMSNRRNRFVAQYAAAVVQRAVRNCCLQTCPAADFRLESVCRREGLLTGDCLNYLQGARACHEKPCALLFYVESDSLPRQVVPYCSSIFTIKTQKCCMWLATGMSQRLRRYSRALDRSRIS